MTKIEAMQILIRAKELGITNEEVEALLAKPESKPATESELRMMFEDEYDEEDIKYWATDYFDELQRIKQLKKERALNGKENTKEN